MGWIILLSLFVLCLAAVRGDDKAALLLTCYNTEHSWEPGTFQDFLNAKPGRLILDRVLWSTKQFAQPARSLFHAGASDAASSNDSAFQAGTVADSAGGALILDPDHNKHLLELPAPLMTIVTAATPSRLDSLEAQCKSWPGPLSVSLYVAIPHHQGDRVLNAAGQKELDRVVKAAQAAFDRLDSIPTACALRLLLLYELVSPGDALEVLLPINALRNAAMLGADTPLVAMVDVDLLLSASLAQEVLFDAKKGTQLAEQCKQRQVHVLAAFETHKSVEQQHGSKLVEEMVQATKQRLVDTAQSERVLIPFAKHVYARGHNATDYARWYQATEAYPVKYQVNYEPWFIVDRCLSLPYDARFRGYGWNKVQQVSHIAASGFTFMVHPDAFLIHRPHNKSSAQGLYNAASNKGTGAGKGARVPVHKLFHRKVAAMRHVALRDLRRGTFKPVVDTESEMCMHTLSWWKGCLSYI